MITRFTEVIESNNFLSKDMNTFISEDDIYCNFDKFTSGKSHVCFVTGVSGSGKSTLAQKLARKYNANYIELDIVMYALDRIIKKSGPEKFRERIHNEHPWIYEWITTTNQDEQSWPKLTSKNVSTYDFRINKAMEFIDWLCRPKGWSTGKPPKFIIEGVDLVDMFPMRLEYTEYPVVFKGTSKIKSMIRRMEREGGFKNYYSGVEGIINLIKAVYDDYYWSTSMQVDQTSGRYKTINRDSSNAKEVDEDSLTAKKMGIVFSDDDVHYNVNRFLNKEVPVLWITGMSGGGKSTLAGEIADKAPGVISLLSIDNLDDFVGIYVIEHDMKTINKWRKDKVYDIIYKFIKDNEKLATDAFNDTHNKEWQDFVTAVLKYVIKFYTPKKQIIIEGVQIPYVYYRAPELFRSDSAIIIKGTSVLTSVIRRYKRDQDRGWFINKFSDIKKYFDMYSMWYRTQNDFRNYVTPNKESYIDPAIIHMQTTDYTCAPACALTLIHYYTGSVSDIEANIASIMGTNKETGTTIHGVIKYFKQLGWTVNSSIQEGSPLAYDDFELFLDYNLGHDNIIMVENKFLDGHWRIIIGYDKDNEQLTFIDPYSNINNGITVMSARDFFTTWYDDNIDSSKTWVTAKPPK